MEPIVLDHQHVWRTYVNAGRLRGGVTDPHYPEEWISSVTEAINPNTHHGEGLSRDLRTGKTLKELIEEDPAGMLGSRRAAQGGGLGVLVKLIDAGERLTIQVHPNAARAKALFGSPYGKTECWYFLDGGCDAAASRPCVYYDFKEGVTRERWEELFRAQDIPGMLDCMHRIEVEPGMVVYVQGGNPHAIGEGCYLLEIQEPTDLTIRVERTTPTGFAVADEMCHLGLEFSRMFDCFDYRGGETLEEARRSCVVPPKTAPASGAVIRTELVGSDRTTCFAMSEYSFSASDGVELPSEDDFRALFVVRGGGSIVSKDSGCPIEIHEGDQVFVPASAGVCVLDMEAGSRVVELRGPALRT